MTPKQVTSEVNKFSDQHHVHFPMQVHGREICIQSLN